MIFMYKSRLNQPNSIMQRVNSRGLNVISSHWFTIMHVSFYENYFLIENQIFVTLSRESYKLRLAVPMPTLKVKLSRLMYILHYETSLFKCIENFTTQKKGKFSVKKR